MLLAQYLCRGGVVATLEARCKDQALQELASVASLSGLPSEHIFSVLCAREKLGSTAVGNGYAIPHGKSSELAALKLFFARSTRGVAFDAYDGNPCYFFFVVLAPTQKGAAQHLALLGSIARLAKDPDFSTRLLTAENATEITNFLMNV